MISAVNALEYPQWAIGLQDDFVEKTFLEQKKIICTNSDSNTTIFFLRKQKIYTSTQN